MKKFADLILEQIVYGGKKYASGNDKMEVTDILVDRYGFSGLMWTINKYAFRFKNQRLEKDLLKIGAYMFIIWLKWGKHLGDFGKYNKFKMLNTNLAVKEKYISYFIKAVTEYSKGYESQLTSDPINQFETLDSEMAKIMDSFKRGTYDQNLLYNVFLICAALFSIYKFKGEQTDTGRVVVEVGVKSVDKQILKDAELLTKRECETDEGVKT